MLGRRVSFCFVLFCFLFLIFGPEVIVWAGVIVWARAFRQDSTMEKHVLLFSRLSHLWSRSNIFTQHFSLRAIVWSFSHLCQQGLFKREKVTNQRRNLGDVDAFFSVVIRRKRYVGSLCAMFGQTLFARLATERFVCNTVLDKNVWSFIRRFIPVTQQTIEYVETQTEYRASKFTFYYWL